MAHLNTGINWQELLRQEFLIRADVNESCPFGKERTVIHSADGRYSGPLMLHQKGGSIFRSRFKKDGVLYAVHIAGYSL